MNISPLLTNGTCGSVAELMHKHSLSQLSRALRGSNKAIGLVGGYTHAVAGNTTITDRASLITSELVLPVLRAQANRKLLMRIIGIYRPIATQTAWWVKGFVSPRKPWLCSYRADCRLNCTGSGPGPELFAKEPRTPLELWDAVDYLLRTNQAKKALPYIDRFIKSKPDNATLIAIRNRYGPGSILRLSDDLTTRSFTTNG